MMKRLADKRAGPARHFQVDPYMGKPLDRWTHIVTAFEDGKIYYQTLHQGQASMEMERQAWLARGWTERESIP
jgi:hypothetical protein